MVVAMIAPRWNFDATSIERGDGKALPGDLCSGLAGGRSQRVRRF
jgi:hypothetical protein